MSAKPSRVSVLVLATTAAIALSCGSAASRSRRESQSPTSRVRVDAVRINWLTNPLGLADPRPRISWRLIDGGLSPTRQSAYQVVAAASPEGLADPAQRLWDSGKVKGAQQTGVRWNGKPLASRQRVHLAVRIWDGEGEMSPLSDPVTFEMGLLSVQDWRARWIASPKTETATSSPFEAAAWIWASAENALREAPAASRWFRFPFALPSGARVESAILLFAANDEAEAFVNGTPVGTATMKMVAKPIDVTRLVRGGNNVLALSARNTGGPAGLIAALELTLVGGAKFKVRTGDEGWLVARRPVPGWNAVGTPAGFERTETLVRYDQPPFEGRPLKEASSAPAPHFFKAFRLERPIKSARAYISGLGYYELFINGRRVGDQVLDPGYTHYGKRVQVVTHDVTELLNAGANAVGVVLGNGFFNQHAADVWGFHKAPWRASPRLLFQLEVTTDDGTRLVVPSDATWKVVEGPIRFDGVRNGEHHDARLRLPHWATARFDASQAPAAHVVSAPGGKLVAREHPPIRVTHTLAPRSVKEVSPSVFLYDFGQNLAGWARLRAKAAAGTEVTLRFGEKLGPDGRLDRKALEGLLRQGDFEVDRYTFAGADTEESWEPSFTYHGFQYVEVSGLAVAPTLEARAINTDFASVGTLFTSDALVNQIHNATRWAYEANFQGIPTDCPHREKNGWTGDAHLAVDAGLFNYDNAAGYHKWVQDMLDAQSAEGALPGIVPSSGWGYDTRWSGPSWEVALFIVPFRLYTFTGDPAVLAEAFPAQQKSIARMQKLAKGHLIEEGLGDWVPWKTKTPVVVTSTASYLQAVRLAAHAARVLGNEPAHRRYTALSQEILAAFQAAFVNTKTGVVAGGEQTALALAITHDLVPAALEARVAERLIESLQKNDFHPDTGVIGAKALLRALSETGHADVAYKVASQTTIPSWGHWIRQGGSTLWESWDGEASRNHVFFGDIDAWYYEVLAGINPDPEAPGFAHVKLAPQVLPGLDQVEGKLETVRGTLESSWHREAGAIRFTFEVPANGTATAELPVPAGHRLALSGRALDALPGLQGFEGGVRLPLAPGRHEFLVAPPAPAAGEAGP